MALILNRLPKMSTLVYQPIIEPQRTLSESAFRLAQSEVMPAVPEESIAHAGQLPLIPNVRFAPIGSDDLWTNRPPTRATARRQRFLPVVKATGRTITQQEIDDALDD
jgi:hypothetical protein